MRGQESGVALFRDGLLSQAEIRTTYGEANLAYH